VKSTLLAVPLALALSACGGSSGREVVRDASESLGTIRSGVVHARLLVQPRGVGQPYGFMINGPFRFGDQPTANVTYVQIANGRRETQKLVISPKGGYVVGKGERRALNASELDGVRQTMRAVRAGGSIVDVSSWVKSSESTNCPNADAPSPASKGSSTLSKPRTGCLQSRKLWERRTATRRSRTRTPSNSETRCARPPTS
jgi:hypothetical protein